MRKMSLNKVVARLLRDLANRFDAGNTEVSESEMLDIANAICHEAMSKTQACRYLNYKETRFDDYVRKGAIPRGRKRLGFNEKVWYKDELDNFIRDNKNK